MSVEQELDVVLHTYNPALGRVETDGSGFQGPSQLHRNLEARPGFQEEKKVEEV